MNILNYFMYIFLMEISGETSYCTHCNQTKPIECFFHYHNKNWPPERIWIHRSICLACENENNKARSKRLRAHKLSKPSNLEIIAKREKFERFFKKKTRVCRICNNEYPLDDENFYFIIKNGLKVYETLCNGCKSDAARVSRGDEIPDQPGVFDTEEDRIATKNLLERMGWKYSKRHKTWWKKNIKSYNNYWFFEKRIRNEREKN